MFGLEISSVPVILPTLRNTLRADFRQLQWVMNAYTIAVTTVLMATGTLADRYGRKRIFVAGIAAFGVVSVVCGQTNSVAVLIAARFLQGLCGGAMLICQVAVLSHQFQDARGRGNAFAAWGVIFGIGLGFGPLVGGAIVAVSSWRWVFLVHGVIAAVAMVLAVAGVRDSRDPDAKSLDVAGIVSLSIAVFALTYFITQGPVLGFGSPMAIGIIAAAVTSFVVFVFLETTTPRPMFDFAVLRIRDFSGALLGSVGMNVSFWPFMIYLPIYFQSGLGYDSVAAGLALLAYTLPTLVAPPLGERLALRYRPGVVIPAGLFTLGLGFLMMRIGAGAPHPGWATMLPGCVLAGIGLGLTNTTVTNTTTGAVPSARAGMASGIDMSARMISLAVNIALMAFILVEGIVGQLNAAKPASADAAHLRAIAEKVAVGAVSSTDLDVLSAGLSPAVLHGALTHGFGLVMLYGCAGVWICSALSFLVFGPRRRRHACGTRAETSVS